MLGITAEELATIYRTQFPVLQVYENAALYDNKGRLVPTDIAKAYRQRGTLLRSGPALAISRASHYIGGMLRCRPSGSRRLSETL